MMQKFVILAAVTLTGAALFVPDATLARGMGGGVGGFHGGGWRAPAMTHRSPFMGRTGPAALGRNGRAFRSILPPPVARHLPANPIAQPTHVGKPFAHLVQRHHGHHHRYFSAYVYPFTTWDDGSYIGVPYDPGAAIPVYGPGPALDPVIDPPPPGFAPRIGMRDEGGDACRAERVTVPAGEGERDITVVRC